MLLDALLSKYEVVNSKDMLNTHLCETTSCGFYTKSLEVTLIDLTRPLAVKGM